MKILFLTLNGENLYMVDGRIRRKRHPLHRWVILFAVLDLLGILYLLIS